MHEALLGETLSKEITKVTKDNEHEVTEVRRDQDVVGGFFYFVLSNWFVGVVLGDTAIALVGAVAKLRVNGGENLFRGGRGAGVREARAVVALVKNGVL